MKRSIIVELIAALFILLFVYTALSKLMDYHRFKVVLATSPLIGNKAEIIALAIPITELTIALLLFLPRTRIIGLWAAMLLMVAFTGYLAYMIMYTPHLPCSCGGVLKQMTWRQHLVFNIAFTLLAITGIKLKAANRLKTNPGYSTT